MAVYALWYGGPSYSHHLEDDDVEIFPNVDAAKRSLLARFNGGWDYVRYATKHEFREDRSLWFPAVTEDAHMLILEIVRGRGAKGYSPGAHVDPMELWTMRVASKLGNAYGVKREKF